MPDLTLTPVSPAGLTITAPTAEVFAVDTNTFVVNATTNRVGIKTASPSHALQINHSVATEKAIYVEQGLATGATANYKPIQLYGEYTGTDAGAATTNVWHGVASTLYYGGSGTPTAALGTVHTMTSEIVVRGSSSQSNEFTPFFSVVRADIGTGYSASTNPGRYWGTDESVHGPIGVQPGLLNGMSMLVNNHYNGSPSSQPSSACWLASKKGSGGGLDATHTAAATYPVDVGLGIVGTASAGTGDGFTKAIRIGGTGSGWAASSRFDTGVEVSDYISYGVNIAARHASGTGPAINLAASTGGIQMAENGSDPSAPAADRVVLYARDNGAGKTQLVARFPTGAVQQVAIEP